MRQLVQTIKCDGCGATDSDPAFTLGQSVRVRGAERTEADWYVDVCVDCKAQGIFACPKCKAVHATGSKRSLFMPRLVTCPRDADLIDKTP